MSVGRAPPEWLDASSTPPGGMRSKIPYLRPQPSLDGRPQRRHPAFDDDWVELGDFRYVYGCRGHGVSLCVNSLRR